MIILCALLITLCSVCDGANSNEFSVIIVGAGASGVAAATKLLKNNESNFIILEAENRIGGRVYSKHFGNAFVDIGAEWCHGQKDNIVYDLVKDFDILRHSNFSKKLFYSNGDIIDDNLCKDIFDVIEQNTGENELYKGVSTGDQLLTLYNNTLLAKYKDQPKKLIMAISAIDFVENFILGHDSAFSWSQIAYNGDFVESEGDQALNWNGHGYKTILEILMQKYPNPNASLPIDDKILLSKIVKSISWDANKSHAVLECTDGSSYAGDHVIFTPSVGVLKANHKEIFKPNLPVAKQDAIDNIGFGAVMKVFLQFSRAWWNEDDYSFAFVWSHDDRLKLAMDFKNGTTKNGISWISYVNIFYPAENNPNVLVAWLSGRMIPEIEILSDQEIVAGCMYTLQRFIGKKYNISSPEKILRSSWYANLNFLGTCSFDTPQAINSGKNLHHILAQPLVSDDGSPRICFAGEATNPIHFSTVHGAIESGFREADRIINWKGR